MKLKSKSEHRGLNPNQINTLKMVCKFRFLTAPLLAEIKDRKSRHAMYEHLELLVKQGYLSKRIYSNELFQNKAGRYCLTSKTIRLLRTEHNVPERNLRVMYKNHLVSDDYVDHLVQVIKVYLSLRKIYPNMFHIFARSELAIFDYFPRPLPDLYLNRRKRSATRTSEYMLELFGDMPGFIIKKRIDNYLVHRDLGDWEASTDTNYPDILLVFSNLNHQKRICKYIRYKLEDSGMDEDMTFYTTTEKQLIAGQNKAIWASVIEPEILRTI